MTYVKYIEIIENLLNIALNHFNIKIVKFLQHWFDYSIVIVDFALTILETYPYFAVKLDTIVDCFSEKLLQTSLMNNDLFDKVIVFLTHYKCKFLCMSKSVQQLFVSLHINTIKKFVLIYNLLYSNNHDLFRDSFIRSYNFENHITTKYKFIQCFPDKIWTDSDGNSLLHYAAKSNYKKNFNELLL